MGHGGYRFFFFEGVVRWILCAVRFPIRNSAPTKSSNRARATGEIRYYLASICFPQRSDNESIPRALTFIAPHPVTFTITPLASSLFGSFTGCTLSLNVISPSIWNEISRACESFPMLLLSGGARSLTSKNREIEARENERRRKRQSSMLPREERYRNRSSGNCRRGVGRSF